MSPATLSRTLLKEDLLSLTEAAKRFPPYRGNKDTASPATIWRWINVGSRARSGEVVRLEACRIGGRWLTSVQALERFSAALAG
jgi:hypothetical protein